MVLLVASFFSFQTAYFLNGHSRSRQRRQIAVNDNPIEAVIDEDQELAEQLGEDVHRFAPRNGRSKPDRAKLRATALGFELADEICYISATGRRS